MVIPEVRPKSSICSWETMQALEQRNPAMQREISETACKEESTWPSTNLHEDSIAEPVDMSRIGDEWLVEIMEDCPPRELARLRASLEEANHLVTWCDKLIHKDIATRLHQKGVSNLQGLANCEWVELS